jgi:hypothetical protein
MSEDTERYAAAAHAMQTGVAYDMGNGSRDTEPKHLRVGVNSALVSVGGLATLLIDKGIITQEEYEGAMADAMEREADEYRKRLPNVTLR